MARRSALRASDADREGIAERLRQAAAEGRLLAEELEERLTTAFSARTYGELDAVVADLPEGQVARRHRGRPTWRGHPIPALALIALIPVVFALAVAALVVIATVLTVWAVAVLVAWWAFGHRFSAFGAAWASGRRAGHWSRGRGRPVGGFSPWL